MAGAHEGAHAAGTDLERRHVDPLPFESSTCGIRALLERDAAREVHELADREVMKPRARNSVPL